MRSERAGRVGGAVGTNISPSDSCLVWKSSFLEPHFLVCVFMHVHARVYRRVCVQGL